MSDLESRVQYLEKILADELPYIINAREPNIIRAAEIIRSAFRLHDTIPQSLVDSSQTPRAFIFSGDFDELGEPSKRFHIAVELIRCGFVIAWFTDVELVIRKTRE